MVKNYDDMFSRFHLIPDRNRRTDRHTDGRTDGQICYINIVLKRDKNYVRNSLTVLFVDTVYGTPLAE